MKPKWTVEKVNENHILQCRGTLTIIFDDIQEHKPNKSINFLMKGKTVANLEFGTHSILPLYIYSTLVHLKDNGVIGCS